MCCALISQGRASIRIGSVSYTHLDVYKRQVQRGTHRELMEEQGLYRRFIQMREAAIGWNLRRKEELPANDGNL